MEDPTRSRRKEKIRDYVDANSKSKWMAVIYALIYGPFGCIYTNPKSTVIALVVAASLAVIYWPLIGLVWLACVIVAPFQVKAYNAKIRRSARFLVN